MLGEAGTVVGRYPWGCLGLWWSRMAGDWGCVGCKYWTEMLKNPLLRFTIHFVVSVALIAFSGLWGGGRMCA